MGHGEVQHKSKSNKRVLQNAAFGLFVKGHNSIHSKTLPIYTHIPNMKSLCTIFLKLSHMKGNL